MDDAFYPLAMVGAIEKYERLVATGQIEPNKETESEYIRQLYLEQVSQSEFSDFCYQVQRSEPSVLKNM